MDLGKAGSSAGVTVLAMIRACAEAGADQLVHGGRIEAIATATFAWMGHGAATEGPGGLIHRLGHLSQLGGRRLIGALVAFALILAPAALRPQACALHQRCTAFQAWARCWRSWWRAGSSTAGSWSNRIGSKPWTSYGRPEPEVAPVHGDARPRGRQPLPADACARPWLERAVTAGRGARICAAASLETAAALGVVALVAWFGTLAPPARCGLRAAATREIDDNDRCGATSWPMRFLLALWP